MAERTEIASEIEALAVHCRPPLMEASSRGMWLRDWCEDLSGFPIDHVRVACRQYRQSGKTKFPTPGELIPLVKAQAKVKPAGERVEAWRELTDEEYEALSLREKIRHHQILSHQAFTKAGPMFRNTSQGPRMSGVHIKPEDMGGAHYKWTEIGQRHAEEAFRLRQYLSGKPLGMAAQ